MWNTPKKKLKQRRRWRQQERQKCKSLDKQNNNSARAAHMFVQFPSLHEYYTTWTWTILNYTKRREHKRATNCFSFPELRYSPLEFNSDPYDFANIWRIERDEISAIKFKAAWIHLLLQSIVLVAVAFVVA